VSDADLAAWSALVRVYQDVLHEVVTALERDAGIDSGMFSVLAHLERASEPGRMPLNELQRLMYPRFSQPGLSRLVQRMETAGLVERRRDPVDGRATNLIATRTGRARFRRANATYASAVHEFFGAHLSAAERKRLTTDLDRVCDRLARARARSR
jgi:DNA-binding MarR family transcriptional regulator